MACFDMSENIASYTKFLAQKLMKLIQIMLIYILYQGLISCVSPGAKKLFERSYTE